MAADAGQSAWFSAGRLALERLAEGLGPALLDDEARAWARRERVAVREGLARIVGRAAFALSAVGRGLVEGTAETLLLQAFTPPLEGAFWRELAPAALACLERAGDPARMAPEDLGSVYEGTLGAEVELAAERLALVRPKKRAGGAETELVVTLRTLLGSRGGARTERLTGLGVKLEVRVQRDVNEARDVDALARALGRSRRPTLRLLAPGESALRLTEGRRRSGSHYTPPALAERVVEIALRPLLEQARAPDEVLALRVCDPSMGTGAFLVASCRVLARRLLELEQPGKRRHGADDEAHARRRVAERCLFGVDRDPVAVEIARLSLWLAVGDGSLPLALADNALCVGEALLGPPTAPPRAERDAFDWTARFERVLRVRGGFDAFVGNPPWVSYVGRAAHPLALELRDGYGAYESFAGYKNLQALFIERSARLLVEGGRLGLLLPSSMSELDGYAPSRRAHDRLCEPDASLTDVGDADFPGVFQPCMVLASTRRGEPLADVTDRAWPLERPDLDALSRALMEKLGQPPLPARLFGERGLQSMGADTAHLASKADERHSVPIRTGSDVDAFRLRTPSLHADPAWFGRRLRPSDEWRAVRFVVRQTARAPLAALSDGAAFRNSLLAGFDDEEFPAAFLVAYLNSTPIRWLHYVRHRDARQGMPQLKVAHLRRTPAPPSRELVRQLDALGRELSAGARRWDRAAQGELDRTVASAFELSRAETARITEAGATLGSL